MNGDSFRISYIDLANFNSVIQSTRSITLANFNFQPDLTFRTPVVLIRKEFNSGGFEAFYTFRITPSRTNMTHIGRIYVEFSAGTPPKLNRDGKSFYCELNSKQIDCELHPTIPRRLIMKP